MVHFCLRYTKKDKPKRKAIPMLNAVNQSEKEKTGKNV